MFALRLPLVAIGIFLVGSTCGMDCTFGSSRNIFEETLQSCPPIFGNQDKSYCCWDINKDKFYCCDAEEFALKTGFGIILPAIIAVVVIISLVVLCISCLCCTCCPWYRRRHRGTVYGNLQQPPTIHVIQTTPAQAGYVNPQIPSQPPPYTAARPDVPQYPPQYTQEAYVKQAPFNPDYAQ